MTSNSFNHTKSEREIQKVETLLEQAKEKQLIEDQNKYEQSGYTQDRDLANQLLGRIQMANGVANLFKTATLADLALVKEKKLYRALGGMTVESRDGQIINVSTWEGYCKAVGTSRGTVDEQIQNLKKFGQEAYEAMQRLRLTTSDFRKLRKIPEEDQTVIINEVKVNAGDKDEIIDLIEKMSARHSHEKEKLEKQLETSQKAIDLKTKDIDRKDSQIIRLKTEIEELKRTELPEDEQEQAALKIIQNSYIELNSIFGNVEFMKEKETSFNVVLKLTHLAEYMEAYGRLLRTELMNKHHQLWEGAPSDNDVYLAEDEVRKKGEQLEDSLPSIKLS